MTMLALGSGANATFAQTAPMEEAAPVPQPEWDKLPMALFPDQAVRQRIDSARVELTCGVRADGAFIDCVIASEDPPGWGFGRSALRAARSARLTRASAATFQPGQRFTFPISWRTVVYDPQP